MGIVRCVIVVDDFEVDWAWEVRKSFDELGDWW